MRSPAIRLGLAALAALVLVAFGFAVREIVGLAGAAGEPACEMSSAEGSGGFDIELSSGCTSIAGVGFQLSFDPAILRVDARSRGPDLTGCLKIEPAIDNTNGLVDVAYACPSVVFGGGGLAAGYDFTCVGGGTSQLDLHNTELTDMSASLIAHSAVDGSLACAASTSTPAPGATNTPTEQPAATATSAPTDIATLPSTPDPPAGPTSTPSATHIPSDTPLPSNTPAPTNTPTPTFTPCLDTDNDGICNSVDPDDDGDGLPDTYESARSCLSALGNDASLDPDGDTLSSSSEWSLGTDPCNRDSDGDRCPDGSEVSGDELLGGLRDPLNPWDYFNPTHDGLNRNDDLLAVVQAYFIDRGNPAYNPDTDRTYIGPNGWNLGPPDGRQRIDDILTALHQFLHDCS